MSYDQLMEGYAYLPTRKANFGQYLNDGRAKFSKHSVTLRVPRVIEEDNYALFTKRLDKASIKTIQMEWKLVPKLLRTTVRQLADNAKETAR